MKKLKFFAFALVASALVFTTSCSDDDNGNGYTPEPGPEPGPAVVQYGTSGDLTWTITEDEVLTISVTAATGTAHMENFENEGAQDAALGQSPWNVYRELFNTVVISPRVASIGDNAFRGNLATDVTIGPDVVTIGVNAFRQMIYLENLTIGSGVTTIGNEAFRNQPDQNSSLATVVIPNSVTSIGVETFRGNHLTEIVIPNSVTVVGDDAFRNNALTTVTIGANVTTILRAFRENPLETVTSHAVAPPTAHNNSFAGVPNTARLYVPAGSVTAYEEAGPGTGTQGWGFFVGRTFEIQ